MSSRDDIPWWADPPYTLLTDMLQLDKVDPWNVDVGRLMGGFLIEMKKLGDIDFRVSGNALYSASVIFMKKTRDLVELGILPPEEEEQGDLVIPMIHPPFRLTNQRVTLQELLVAMDRVLSKGTRQRTSTSRRKRYSTRGDPLQVTMDTARADVEENIYSVYMDLRGMMIIGDKAKFIDVLMNNSRSEVVRVFFALLHLFARAFVDIWMDDDEVIWVELLPPPAEDTRLPDDEEELKPEIRG